MYSKLSQITIMNFNLHTVWLICSSLGCLHVHIYVHDCRTISAWFGWVVLSNYHNYNEGNWHPWTIIIAIDFMLPLSPFLVLQMKQIYAVIEPLSISLSLSLFLSFSFSQMFIYCLCVSKQWIHTKFILHFLLWFVLCSHDYMDIHVQAPLAMQEMKLHVVCSTVCVLCQNDAILCA